MAKEIYESECPACGEILEITELGYSPCPCGGATAELIILWEINAEKE